MAFPHDLMHHDTGNPVVSGTRKPLGLKNAMGKTLRLVFVAYDQRLGWLGLGEIPEVNSGGGVIVGRIACKLADFHEVAECTKLLIQHHSPRNVMKWLDSKKFKRQNQGFWKEMWSFIQKVFRAHHFSLTYATMPKGIPSNSFSGSPDFPGLFVPHWPVCYIGCKLVYNPHQLWL